MRYAITPVALLLLLFAACTPHTFVRPGGPPPHAPAHGRRAKTAVLTYRYYPDLEIYWSPAEQYWMVLRNGAWVRVTVRPAVLTDAFGYVVLKPAEPAPWKRHKHYRGKYPPGQLKKKHGKPAKNNKHKWK